MSHFIQLVLYGLSSGGFMSADTKENFPVTGELPFITIQFKYRYLARAASTEELF